MTVSEYIKAIETRKGANLSAVWVRQMATRKGIEDVVEKRVEIVVRGGVEYDNLSRVQERRESGELPSENSGLPWGEWVQYPFHIKHKGVDYVRMYPASGLHFIPKTTYLLNGVEVTRDTVEPMCLAKEFSRTESPECYTIKADNLVSIR